MSDKQPSTPEQAEALKRYESNKAKIPSHDRRFDARHGKGGKR